MSRERRLAVVVAVNAAMVVALVLVGLFAHSLGVLASGADYLGDGAGAALSLFAVSMRRRRRGRPQLTSYAALTNASLLLLATAAVAADGIYRLSRGAPAIHSVPVIVVSVIAALAMIACAAVLGDVSGDLSMQSVMLDTVADAAAAIGVALSAAVILVTGAAFWLDSAVALLIAIVVGYHAVRLILAVRADLRSRLTPAPPSVAARQAHSDSC
jgi:cobalt-zinc-cadmium efflux system protein